ncbi:MAG TPA: 4-hydroxy-3-methylbut-2-enyl diphosphate reductase [Candidatus Polarisedimenticolaceae bacterium]|nr:4-hydroxy-3-methylbut-2-enyl diphosphate reductase [Candidatus Polarisedimenticolaceae bacterium]
MSPYTNRGFGLKQVIGGQVVRDYASPLVDAMRAEGFVLAAGDLTFRLAQEFGFCYGVDRAIEYAYETREKFPDKNLFITGEIIHNPRVNGRLREMGIRFLDGRPDGASIEDLGEDDVVLLPAFGVPFGTMERLREAGCLVVDTTCGSVLNVWKNVERYARDGFTALIHGTWNHEETRATSSRALLHPGGSYLVVRDMEETEIAASYVERGGDPAELLARFAQRVSPGFDPDVHLQRLGCANQTTMLAGESLAIAERMRLALVRRWGVDEGAARFRAFDTICSATQERQDALHAMLDATPPDVLVVIGGYNSSNTTHLLEIGLARGIPTFHIQDASRILGASSIRHQPLHAAGETETADWLPARPLTIGVTAGASTPNAEIERVIRRVAEVRGIALS